MTPLHRSQKFIAGAQYFLYFGVMGIYLPYFNLYCYHLGFSGFEIGTLSAARSVVLIIFPLIWSGLADRYHARRSIYILCNGVSTVLWAGFLLTTDFRTMLALSIVYGIFYAPLISFLEAFAMDILCDRKEDYGQMRVWGSMAFIAMVVIMGWIIDIHPIQWILAAILLGSAVQAGIAPWMPATVLPPNTRFLKSAREFLNFRTTLFLGGAFVMLLSHGAYYGFFSIHLETLGYGKTFIGICWALASLAEILVMVNSGRIFDRFKMMDVLLFSFAAAAFRWLLLSHVRSATAILLLQLTHAVTYGAFHVASILYVDRLSSRETKTFGQAVNNALTYGLGLMVGFFASGILYEKIGSHGLFRWSAAAAVAGGIIIAVSRVIYGAKVDPIQSPFSGKKR